MRQASPDRTVPVASGRTRQTRVAPATALPSSTPSARAAADADADVAAQPISRGAGDDGGDSAATVAVADAPAVAAAPTDIRALGTTGAARTTLDWRALLARPGITLGIEEIADASSGTAALADAHAVRTHSSFELALDMDSLAGWSGLTVYAQFKSKNGRNGSGAAAFTQNYSNIDADDFQSFGEVFVEQRLLRDRLRIKAGRLDFNSEFAGTDNGGGFLNASMGYSPSIWAAPTFPLPTSGVNVFVEPREHLTIGVGVFNGLDGAPAAPSRSSRFEIAQANQTWTLGSSTLPGRVGLGYFRHTGLFLAANDDEETAPHLDGTHGWYGAVDQTLWHGAMRSTGGDAEPTRSSIGAFAQFGHGDAGVQSVHSHRGGGLTFSGLSSRRPDDMIGVGLTSASWNGGGEFIGEVYYQLPVIAHLSVVADWQRVRRREARASQWLGSVFTMRTIVSF